jgi:tetratricopeptide (TPR) repeat protein
MFIPLLVVAAGLLAYHNSFTGPFIFDDVPRILENPSIRHLWPPWSMVGHSSRPVVQLSLTVNYALGGFSPWGYHLFNIAIHILAALTLYGVVRRTFLSATSRPEWREAAPWLAAAVAVIWEVHPLQTESVTYIIQRCESLMGLFILLTLYCVIRGAASPRRIWWNAGAVVSCALAMGCKPVAVIAPVVVALYDRACLSGSWREIAQRRGKLYVGLAATWLWLALLLARGPLEWRDSAGFGFKAITPFQYGLTEPGVIAHYLRLAFWPDPLCLDYAWPAARTPTEVWPGLIVVGALLAATVWAWRRKPALGFLGAWFFIILAPTSSFIPIADPAFEHRLYLPLAAVVVLGVSAVYALLGRRSLPVFLALAVGLGFLTTRRNEDYRSELSIWSDTVAKRPDNVRAQYNLGNVLTEAGRATEAIGHYEQALRINPGYAEAHNNLGNVLQKSGRETEAKAHFERSLQINPKNAEAHNNLGNVFLHEGKVSDAIGHYEQALRIKPDYAEAHVDLGNALFQMGKVPEAIAEYEQALRIKPDLAEAHNNLGGPLMQIGRVQDAIGHLLEALRLNPDFTEAHFNLGNALSQAGQGNEAIGEYEQALRLKPDYAEAHRDLALALERNHRLREAIGHYEQALQIMPDRPESQNNLAWLLATLPPPEGGDPVRAVTLAERACQLTNNQMAPYLDTLAAAYASAGRFNDAVATAQKAIDLANSARLPHVAKQIESRLQLYRRGQPYRRTVDATSSPKS